MRAMRVKKLYDGTQNPPAESAIVVIDGEKIKEVLPACTLSWLDHLQLPVESWDDYVMTPGLIDAHVHLMLPGDGTLGEDLLARTMPGEVQILAYQNAETALASGVTTMRDVGAAGDVDLAVRQFYKSTAQIGPDLLCCGAPLTATGGHCHYMGGEVDSPTEIRKQIRIQQKKGTDWVKVMATAGGTRGISQGDPFTLRELSSAVSEAHRQGMGITMHASRIRGLRKAAASAPDGLEHCQFTDQWHVVEDKALAELICRNGTVPCHTMAVNVSILSYLKDKPREQWTQEENTVYPAQKRWLGLMPAQLAFQLSQGVPTVGGSDAGWRYTSFHDGMVISMEMMERAGMGALEIIHACTGRNAAYLGLGDRLGTIQPGKQADLLLLRNDPAKGISSFRTMEKIFKKGCPIQPLWTQEEAEPSWMRV